MSIDFRSAAARIKDLADPRSRRNLEMNAVANGVAEELFRRARKLIAENHLRRPRGQPVIWLLQGTVTSRASRTWYIFETGDSKRTMTLCRTTSSRSSLNGLRCPSFGGDRVSSPWNLLVFAGSIRLHGGLKKWLDEMLKGLRPLTFHKHARVEMIAPRLS